MSVIQIGIVDKTAGIDAALVDAAAAALNIQVMRDLTQFWKVHATVRRLPDPHRIPLGVWPVFLVDKLPPGEGGVHMDKKNQPYSLVVAKPGKNDWTIDASHEILEMLIDPSGNWLLPSRAIKIAGDHIEDTPGQFEYLVEACDPCEANHYAYPVDGIAVSDFITPHFYDPVVTPGTRYSYCGNVQRPRQILPGGYISFVDSETDEFHQILFLGGKPELRKLGKPSGSCLRMFIEARTNELVQKHRKPNEALSQAGKDHRKIADAVALRRGKSYPTEPTDDGDSGRS